MAQQKLTTGSKHPLATRSFQAFNCSACPAFDAFYVHGATCGPSSPPFRLLSSVMGQFTKGIDTNPRRFPLLLGKNMGKC
jgi:hypothetical protein